MTFSDHDTAVDPGKEEMRRAGEEMFLALAKERCHECGYPEPRRPNDCKSCERKGAAMDQWDAALAKNPLSKALLRGVAA